MKKLMWGMLSVVVLLVLASCQRPFDVPEFKDIGPNQTAFLIPITGDTADQTKFASVDYLQSNMVSAKRVQIPHEWVQTGKRATEGKWMPTHALIIVDRTPVSVTWLSTSGEQKIGVESLESTGISVGVSLSAMIEEANAATFLYWYPNMSLSQVVNSNVNAYVKSQFALEFGKLSIDQIRNKKGEVFTAVFTRTAAFFKPYGITISQLGFTEGLVYDDAKLQTAMDEQTRLLIENANLAQKKANAVIENQMTVAAATAAADAKAAANRKAAEVEAYRANTAASTVATQKALADIEIRKLYAQAALEFAKNSKFAPTVVSEGVLQQMNLTGFLDAGK